MNKLIEQIKQWHYDRNLIEGSTDKAQFSKLQEEVLELHGNIIAKEWDSWLCEDHERECKADDIGDILVVLINIAERNGLTLEQCLEKAYDDIKDRRGIMLNGVFVKEEE